jgi:hypothetical protein
MQTEHVAGCRTPCRTLESGQDRTGQERGSVGWSISPPRLERAPMRVYLPARRYRRGRLVPPYLRTARHSVAGLKTGFPACRVSIIHVMRHSLGGTLASGCGRSSHPCDITPPAHVMQRGARAKRRWTREFENATPPSPSPHKKIGRTQHYVPSLRGRICVCCLSYCLGRNLAWLPVSNPGLALRFATLVTN